MHSAVESTINAVLSEVLERTSAEIKTNESVTKNKAAFCSLRTLCTASEIANSLTSSPTVADVGKEEKENSALRSDTLMNVRTVEKKLRIVNHSESFASKKASLSRSVVSVGKSAVSVANSSKMSKKVSESIGNRKPKKVYQNLKPLTANSKTEDTENGKTKNGNHKKENTEKNE